MTSSFFRKFPRYLLGKELPQITIEVSLPPATVDTMFKHLIVALLFTTSFCLNCSAQIITWDSIQTITSNDDIINPGKVVRAINFGGIGDSIVDVGGNSITFEGETGPFNSRSPNIGFFNAAGTSVDSDFESVLDSFAFTTNGEESYTFTGLDAGGIYNLQLFLSDDRPATWNVELDINGSTTTLFTNGSGASTFATALVELDSGQTSFTVNFDGLPSGPGGNSTLSNFAVANAMVLTAVPEPGTLGLMSLLVAGGGGLFWRKRRKEKQAASAASEPSIAA